MTAATRGRVLALGCLLSGLVPLSLGDAQQRPRARALGIVPGTLPPGRHNAITDVAGVRVGHTTVVQGDSVRTGVTAILPHPGNLFFDRVLAAIHVGNGFGKLLGVTQVSELGELETPVLLTCTLCVWKAADAMAAYLLELPGMEAVRSINPVVGETNDGYVLNAIRSRPIALGDVLLVQSNFGGDLQILGVPVGRRLGRSGVKAGPDPQGARAPS